MDPTKGLHGEQSIEILTPNFPKSGNVIVTGRTVGVWDGGKGAIIAKWVFYSDLVPIRERKVWLTRIRKNLQRERDQGCRYRQASCTSRGFVVHGGSIWLWDFFRTRRHDTGLGTDRFI